MFRRSSSDPGAESGGLSRSALLEDASQWFATLSDTECSDEERREFADWLRRSNLHVEEFLRVSLMARRLSNPKLWSSETVEQLVLQARQHPNQVTHLPRASAPKKPSRWWPAGWKLGIAAACMVSLLATLFVFYRSGPEEIATIYSTAVGEQRSVVLADGSVVELNTQSLLQTRFTASERTVELLRGEAIFKVAKNSARPFRVICAHSQIVAVGTEFNVYAQNQGTVVTVLEGRVRVSHQQATAILRAAQLPQPDSDAIELAQGQQAVIAPQRPIIAVALDDVDKATAWTERRLIFEDTPLAEVTAEFARYYTARTIRVADPELASLHITGVFNASDPASLVQFLQTFGAVEIREDEYGWVLIGGRQENLP